MSKLFSIPLWILGIFIIFLIVVAPPIGIILAVLSIPILVFLYGGKVLTRSLEKDLESNRKESKEIKANITRKKKQPERTEKKLRRIENQKVKARKELVKTQKPVETITYADYPIKVYKGNGLEAYVVSKSKRIYPTLRASKQAVLYFLRLKGFNSESEYFAFKEAELRKKENIELLAGAYKKRSSGKEFLNSIKEIDNLQSLTPVEFERWAKNLFEKKGWVVEETKVTGDGGVDLILEKNDRKAVAQCKRFKGNVGEPLLRDFYGALLHSGASEGYFVTTGLFTSSTIKWVENKPIFLLDRGTLLSYLS